MRTLLLLTLLALHLPLQAWEDGFYRTSDSPTDDPVMALDGQQVFLTSKDKVPDDVKSGRLVSDKNDNSSYRLDIDRTTPAAQNGGHLVLILGGKCLRFYGWGGDIHHSSLSGEVSDPAYVQKLADFLKIKPQDRAHPGHQFAARFKVREMPFSLTEPIVAMLEITNCGEKPFSIIESPLPETWLRTFSFTAFEEAMGPELKAIAVVNKGSSALGDEIRKVEAITIKPQETKSIPVDLADYLVFKKAGRYAIRGTYAFAVVNPDTLDTLWDDFATADFELKLE